MLIRGRSLLLRRLGNQGDLTGLGGGNGKKEEEGSAATGVLAGGEQRNDSGFRRL